MDSQGKVRIGLGAAVVGLVLAAVSLTPQFVRDPFPWPLITGIVFYLFGSVFLAANARGQAGKDALSTLRIVRLLFFALVLMMMFRMGTGR